MHLKISNWKTVERVVVFVLFVISCFVLSITQRYDFLPLIGSFSVAFLSYLYVAFTSSSVKVGYLIGVALLVRLLFFNGLPLLSDDVYRFIWDGRLIANGIHPFQYIPSDFMKSGIEIRGIDQALFERLNSPDFFTIYPPVSQAIFWLGAKIFPTSVIGSITLFRVVLLLFEGLVLYSLYALGKNTKYSNAWLHYAFNPLVIVETIGNIHFEGAMIGLFLCSLVVLNKKITAVSSGLAALSVASKLLTAMFIPFVFCYKTMSKRWVYLLTSLFFGLLLFIPLLVHYESMLASLSLYANTFEFNASIYYLAKWLSVNVLGEDYASWYSWVFMALSAVVIGGLLLRAMKRGIVTLEALCTYCLGAIAVYYSFAIIVHPWYIILVFTVSLLTSFRFGIAWSYLVFWSYYSYGISTVNESIIILTLQYSLLYGYVLYEIYSKLGAKSFARSSIC